MVGAVGFLSDPEFTIEIDRLTLRVTRMFGAFAAVRIINPKLVPSPLLGGMNWGMSFALQEVVVDRRSGRVMNANLADYHVPVNADVPAMEVLTSRKTIRMSTLGIKCVGEIGIKGNAGAVAAHDPVLGALHGPFQRATWSQRPGHWRALFAMATARVISHNRERPAR